MKRSGFTLVELLVVIAVIALLVAILIPVLRNSKQRARAVSCSSNIRQLAFGMFMYESENQTFPYGVYDTFVEPPGGYRVGSSSYDRMGWWWFHFIEEFYEKSNKRTMVICCPSKRLNDSKLNNNILCGNYGVNRSICKSSVDVHNDKEEFVGKPLGSSDIPHPAQTLLIVDSGYTMISWWHVTNVPPVALDSDSIEDNAYVPGLSINKDKGLWRRHPSKTVNVGFADGTVAQRKADDLLVEKEGDAYMNRSPLWVPQ